MSEGKLQRMGQREDKLPIVCSRSVILGGVVLVGWRSEFAVVERLLPAEAAHQRISRAEALVQLHLQRVEIIAGAITLIEDTLRETVFEIQRAAQIGVGTGSRNRGVQIEAAIQMAPYITDVAYRQTKLRSDLALNGEIPHIHVRDFLIGRNVGYADPVGEGQHAIGRNRREDDCGRSGG